MKSFQDAFISYGRADSKQFVQRLNDCLLERGFEVWFDFEDIPLGVDFQKQIADGIEKADNFIFVISPHAVNSPYCLIEIELALKWNKRIIPLLHVEEISYTTWKERNPAGSPDEWEAYKVKGRHSSFANMHPEISKINWVYFREGVDNFDASIAGLVEIFERQEDYVRNHTYFLNKALEWERNQKQVRYLLGGETRQAAEKWLKLRFHQEQPPCIPTDLHCEFITESIKLADSWMTQVFLCAAQEDLLVKEQVRKSLIRQEFTVWNRIINVQMGEDLQLATNRGIEEADNLVYLLSPESLRSQHCQRELDYAFSLKKRIIPLQVRPVEPHQMPEALKNLHCIDLSDNVVDADYEQDENQLIKVLRQNAKYHRSHKLLLAKALKWERQKHNASILLRGYNLRQFEAWLKVAQQQKRYLPTPLQETFLLESSKQLPNQTLDVFVAYARADADFAYKINDALQMQGKTTWFDQESIASGTDFQQEIYRGIENSEHFLLIISPSTTNSFYCLDELKYAQTLNKRVIPILYRTVSAAFLPPGIANIQWVDFSQENADFLVMFGELIRTLDKDPDRLKRHTRLLVRALEWEHAERDDSYLLRGKDLATSVQWLQESAHKEPQPTALQQEYIRESQALPNRRIKLRSVWVTSAIATLLVAAVRFFAGMQSAELRTYDHLMRLRLDEPKDDRFLVVTVDEASGGRLRGEYGPGYGTIPDPALEKALDILETNKPRLVGVDFYRDFAATPALAKRLRDSDNIVALCKSSKDTNEYDEQQPGVLPPPEVPLNRIGFNAFLDDGEEHIRRHYLMAAADPDTCNVRQAFSLILARKYLEAENIAFSSPWNEKGKFIQDMRVGSVVVPQLWGNGSGYRSKGNTLIGYQTLINFRVSHTESNRSKTHRDLSHFVDSVNFEAVLNQSIPSERIRDRIVIIGYTDKTDRNSDIWSTPYGETSGVFLQAQMTSQIISAVLDQRPLIWWWPMWLETLWIFVWAGAGGAVFWRFIQPPQLAAAAIVSVLALYAACALILALLSGWIPLVPTAIAWLATGSSVAFLNHRFRNL